MDIVMQYERQCVNNLIGKKINASIVDSIVDDIHISARKSVSAISTNGIYDELENLGYKVHTPFYKKFSSNPKQYVAQALNLFLSEYMEDYHKRQEKYIEIAINRQILQMNLKETKNKNYMVSPDNKYFKRSEFSFVEDKKVIDIYNDGSYAKKTLHDYNINDYLITKYDENDNIISLRLINCQNKTYKDEKLVAKKLNLKQEFINRFKLSSSSQENADLLAQIGNMFFRPIPSGYYMDKRFNIFKWNNISGSFEKVILSTDAKNLSSNSEYEVKDKIVIRTDYANNLVNKVLR